MKLSIYLLITASLATFAIAKEKEKVEKPALPNATLSDISWGNPVNEAVLKKDELVGKVVIIEEWGVKCPPCIASLPNLARMAKSGDKKGLVVVGFEAQGSTKEDILKVLKTARVEYPVMSGGSVPGGNGGIPRACVFDSTGKVVYNGSPHDPEFEKAVKKAMREIKPKA
jgi:thiol-disulfide isomerase/thioredoxin